MNLVIDMEMPNRKPNRIADYDYSQTGAYFVTVCTQERKKILSKISVGTPVPGNVTKLRKAGFRRNAGPSFL